MFYCDLWRNREVESVESSNMDCYRVSPGLLAEACGNERTRANIFLLMGRYFRLKKAIEDEMCNNFMLNCL